MIKMNSFGETPYVLTGDFHVTIQKSAMIQRFIEAGLVVDLPEAWRPADKDQQVTFSKYANIQEGLAGLNTSRIDTILANRAAAPAVTSVGFLYELSAAYDYSLLI